MTCTASPKAASMSGVLVRSASARITALPPPIGNPAMAFLKLIPRLSRNTSRIAAAGSL
jgi:hypothetical protein